MMKPKRRYKDPYDDEGNFWTRLARDHRQSFTTSDDYYAFQTMGCFLQLIFYCFLGFIIYLFIAWATQPSDYTFATSEEWYEKFDVEDEFNLEAVDVFECSSDDGYKYRGFVGIDRKNRQILHTYYSGVLELNSTYKTDFNVDESNVTRFCSLLDELTKITNTKFIIITHHALTMSRMDRLYGVTMAEQGVSQLDSVDLQRAEELLA